MLDVLAMTRMRKCSGLCPLLVAVWVAACADEPAVEDLGALGDGKADTALPRTIALDVAAGATKRFRITTTGFVASLDQDGDLPVRLTAKHYDLEVESETPDLVVVGDAAVRNWTLGVTNLGGGALTGTLVVDVPRKSAELGVVSDIDQTVMPPASGSVLPAPYPGIAALLTTLDAEDPGNVRYVTARTPAAVVEVPDWLALHGVPAGTIDTGISGVPWIAQAEKVRDISRILDASGDQPYVMFGDTSHRDPEVYAEILVKYPSRVAAVFIHKVDATVPPARVAGMHLVENYAQAAALAFGDDLLTEAKARGVMRAARDGGLAITDAEIDALIDAAR